MKCVGYKDSSFLKVTFEFILAIAMASPAHCWEEVRPPVRFSCKSFAAYLVNIYITILKEMMQI